MMTDLGRGAQTLKVGAIMRKHKASSVLEGLRAELDDVRVRGDLPSSDAVKRYEFLIESTLALAESLKDSVERLNARIDTHLADSEMHMELDR
jgi:hypothetical protein